jgi:alkylation response protein AidB-like acyl-CoA dehydrogenase
MASFEEKLARVTERFSHDAAEVDRAAVVPREHFDALADLGLYGAFAPESYGGLGLSLSELCDAIEALAAGCLASTFVFIQHLRLLASVLDDAAPDSVIALRSQVIRGEVKGGVALAGLLPGPPRLTATPTTRGWLLHGSAPWVSGWDLVDELFVAARGPNDMVINVLVAPHEQPGLVATRQEMSAIDATSTVALTFDSLDVSEDRVVSSVAYEPQHEAGPGLRLNGSLSLGVARRCCAVIGASRLDEELREARDFLDGADATMMPRARARASALAARAASALCVYRGSASVIRGDLAERTNREAALLLAFGSRPAIRAALLEDLIPA